MRIFFLYYFFIPQVSLTQSAEIGLADQFFRNQKVVWQKSYTGLWDDAIPVQIELVSDGTSCKGYFYFGDSKTKYVVSGSMAQNEIKLEEQDLNSTLTGRIVLLLNDKSARGTWYNAAKSFNARLTLSEGATIVPHSFWIRSYGSKSVPGECMVLQHKEFADQINTRFYYKLLNKTLHGTSEIKGEETYSQESVLEDYLHHSAGTLSSWKANDKRLDIHYKLGTMEYTNSLDLLQQIPIAQETFADHWIAVDINYPKLDKPEITAWYRNVIDSFLIIIQDKKAALLANSDMEESNRLSYRMSVWPQIEFLNDQFLSGLMHIKNSWDESISSIPFTFDLKKGKILTQDDLFIDPLGFDRQKNLWLKTELEKLASGSDLEYKSLKPADFGVMTLKKEGFVFSAPFDLVYGQREIVMPYTLIQEKLSPRYFPL